MNKLIFTADKTDIDNSALQVFTDAIVANSLVASNNGDQYGLLHNDGNYLGEKSMRAFFNKMIAPLYRETKAKADLVAVTAKPNEKVAFAQYVIYELYRRIIEPNLERWGKCSGMSFSIILLASYMTKHTDGEPFKCACEVTRLLAYAPLFQPQLNPDRVRTLGEEAELDKQEDALNLWGKLFFRRMCEHFCKP